MLKTLKSIILSAFKGVANDPFIRKLLDKHPRLAHFVKKRISPDEKFGLYLTIGAIISLFFVYLFFGLVQDLIGNDPIVQSDLRIINLIQILRSPNSNQVMLLITYLGKWQIILLGLVFVSVIFIILKRRYELIALWTSVIGSELFIWLVKNLIARPRPSLVNALAPETSYSFPSGHGFIAFSFYGLLTYFIFRLIKKKGLKVLAIISGVFIILAIGFSRIYLGVHWPTDVLASYASGAAWLTFLITMIEIYKKFHPINVKKILLAKKYILLLCIIFLFVWLASLGYYFITQPIKLVTAAEKPKIVISANDLQTNLFAKLTKTSEDITGAPMEPINIIIVGSQEKLKGIFTKAGWLEIDSLTPSTIWHLITASFLNKPYDTAPGTPSFWNTQPNDLAFEQPTKQKSVRERNHIHFWQTNFEINNNSQIWVGTAHYDQKIELSLNFFLPTHKIDPAIDGEREKVKNDLWQTADVSEIKEFQLVEPTLGQNQAGDQFFTDGKAYIIFLK